MIIIKYAPDLHECQLEGYLMKVKVVGVRRAYMGKRPLDYGKIA